jgi:hypothetical protein
MTAPTSRRLPAALLAAALAAPGCGGPRLSPVRGQVFYKGEPAAGALLAFHPKGPAAAPNRPTATVGPDGSFTVSTFAADDGAPDGEYGVTVVWLRPPAGAAKAIDPERAAGATDRLNGRYANPNSPKLTATVRGDTTLPRFDLD